MRKHDGAIVQTTPFNFQGHDVRTVVINDEPLIVGKDACNALGIKNSRDALNRLDQDGVGIADVIDTLGRRQSVKVVTEAALYELIFQSRVEHALEFKRWVTREVLPTIRKHGAYMTEQKIEQVLTDPDTIIKLATDLKAERQRRAELEAQREIDAPKVVFADAVAASKTDVLVGDLAKILKGNGVNIGANRLFKWLRWHGYLISRKGADWNMPTQKSMELGLFRIKETAVTHSDGHVSVNKTSKVTGKGQQYFIERFLNGTFEAA